MLKRILSYIYPVTQKISSSKNGILELTWYNGRKVLNTKNANYSYGSLQQILAFALSKIELKKVENVLLLGMGAGSVIQTLREEFQFNKKITAIEFDETIIQIAQDEYGIVADDKLSIHCADAYKYAQNESQKYDLVIIDLFIDNRVPEQFYSEQFLQAVTKLVKPNGYFIFNLGMGAESLSKSIQAKIPTNFTFQNYEKVIGTNEVLLGRKL